MFLNSPGLGVVVRVHRRIHVVQFVAVENPLRGVDVRRAVEENIHGQRHDDDWNQAKQCAGEGRRGNQAEHAPEVKSRWIHKLRGIKRTRRHGTTVRLRNEILNSSTSHD